MLYKKVPPWFAVRIKRPKRGGLAHFCLVALRLIERNILNLRPDLKAVKVFAHSFSLLCQQLKRAKRSE